MGQTGHLISIVSICVNDKEYFEDKSILTFFAIPVNHYVMAFRL